MPIDLTTRINTLLVPKVFKDISGPNYEINYFRFKLPTNIDGFKYNSINNVVMNTNMSFGDEYYNKLPYYVNIVDNNSTAITGETVHDMTDLKPNSMFGVIFENKVFETEEFFKCGGIQRDWNHQVVRGWETCRHLPERDQIQRQHAI